jgi:hypothetical protein
VPRDVRDHDVAVVDGVLDGDDVALLADRGEVDVGVDAGTARVEVVDVQFHVVVRAPLSAPEELAHQAHRPVPGWSGLNSYVRRVWDARPDAGCSVRDSPPDHVERIPTHRPPR